MKSYTDIEQSKKLADILPLESADMYYEEVCNLPKAIVGNYILHNQCMEDKDYKKLSNPVLSPAWSLAALLDIIPKEVKIKGQKYAPCLFPITDGHWLYKLWYNSNEIIESPISIWCDNPVDACYEMIIKLYKLNLL